jgi:RNA polymerase sigma factor (sigma-70 family)
MDTMAGWKPGPATTGIAPADAALAREEETLLVRARAGDSRAFARLVDPYLGLLFRLAARTTYDAALAEDAVQETLLAAHRQLGRYTPGTSLRAYLAAIAVRKAHTLVRSEARRHSREQRVAVEESEFSAEDHLAAQESRQRLERALAKLPRKRREAVILRLDAGLSHAEIADVLGSSEGSVRVLVHLALKELKQQMEGDHA